VAFFAFLRRLTCDGYFTSKIGFADLQYMGNTALRDFPGAPAFRSIILCSGLVSGYGVYQDLRFGFRLAVVIGIWLMPTPMPPRTFGGYFPRAFSAATFVLNGFEILSG